MRGRMRGKMIRVLIVDDDKLARKGLVSLMNWEAFGMTVVGDVQNGKAALQFIVQHPVDLVFVDIDMPEMNGIVFMEECRRQKPDIEFVVLSFFEDFSYVQATLRLGGLDYISKTSMELDHCDTVLERIVEKYKARSRKAEAVEKEEPDLGAVWEECRLQHWFFGDVAFERLKERIREAEPKLLSVRRLEMMLARCIGELEDMLQLPESTVPLLSGTEEMIGWLAGYRRKVYDGAGNLPPGSDAGRILKAVLYMKGHLGEDLSTSTVADHIGCSRSYFCIIFKRFSGLSFGDYLQQLRIERAKELLLHTRDLVTEIAFQSGYNDIYYFNRVFRKAVGCSPMEFRKREAMAEKGQEGT